MSIIISICVLNIHFAVGGRAEDTLLVMNSWKRLDKVAGTVVLIREFILLEISAIAIAFIFQYFWLESVIFKVLHDQFIVIRNSNIY